MDTTKILLYGGGAFLAYKLFLQPSGASPAPVLSINPAPVNSLIPVNPVINPNVPTSYGVNGGYAPGITPALVSNYNTLLAVNPNLGNPNYQLTDSEANQYATNYLDLQQGLATWPGGLNKANLQKHWSLYGCAEKRIFMQLVPPSTNKYIPPPANAKAAKSGSGSSWIGPAIQTAGMIVVALLGVGDETERLNDAEIQLMLRGSGIIKDLLPFYIGKNPNLVTASTDQLNDLLTYYS